MRKRRWVMWQGIATPSLERCILARSEGGFEFDGLILQAIDGIPYVARYRIQVDQAWTTQHVEVELANGGRRTLTATRDAGGEWRCDGQPLSGFDGCIDVDLEWSPSTNTLPIRRLNLSVGQTAAVSATWIRFPSLQIERLEQSYERLSDDRYRYRSGRFMADLSIDPDGLVVQYGLTWKAVATSGEHVTPASTTAGPAGGTIP